MKIMFVINNMDIGGAQRVVSVLAREMVSQGHSVSIVMTEKNFGFAYELDSRIVCIDASNKLKLPKFQLFWLRVKYGIKAALCPVKRGYNQCRKYYDIKAHTIKKLTKQMKPDIIYSFLLEANIPICMASDSISVPCVIAERNYPDRENISESLVMLRKQLYKRADLCVFQTEEQRAFFKEIPENKCRIIPNPIKEDLPEPYYGQRKKIIVNYCGLRPQKNLMLLIDAFELVYKRHRDCQLRIYGDGEQYQELLNRIHELGLDQCADVLPFEKNIHSKVLDYAVFVSSSDYEGMPNSLLEAMAIGLPVVSTDCLGGGAGAVIKNNINGILVPIRDAKALADGITYMLDNPDEAAQMANLAVNVRDNLSVANIAEQWIELINL